MAEPRVFPESEEPGAAVDGVVDRVRDVDVGWWGASRVTDALPRLEELAAKRARARRVVEQFDEEIEVAVEHLRVDGASWVQIARALRISRQGARQRFDSARRAHRIRQDPRDPQILDR